MHMLEFYVFSVLSLFITWTFAQVQEASLRECQVNPRVTSDPCALAKVVGGACDPEFLISQTYGGIRAGADTLSVGYVRVQKLCGFSHWACIRIPDGKFTAQNTQVSLPACEPDVMLGDQTSTSETETISGRPTQTESSKGPGLNNRTHDPAIIAGGVIGGAVFVLLAKSWWEGPEPFLLLAPIDPLRNSKGSIQRHANQNSQTEWQESWRVYPSKGLKILTVDPCSDHSHPSQEQSSMQGQSMDESRNINGSRTDTPQQVPEPIVIDRPHIVTDPENPRSRVESNEETDTDLAFSESQYRAMQARMDRLVAEIDEIRRFVPPPAYHS
ncbi:hypothetical protein K435DRAFT_934866 [Dendrothele bispora CBS 962.96]|uniref:Uncharacterized protein n=1 Tax=Dendrothele bispora (strain CBS 962.96) TaxID=1314807 RepID=A0A4S8L0Y8_DENBC|nr:hypothetical protein K435DRAFT_934866 [Dendrothele bispora CBS 962.96]